MKKIFRYFLLLVGMVLVFGIVGCNAPQSELQSKIEVRGRFYLLEVAYDNGWLDEDDLKSIACCYNDFQKKDNPYSGLYEPPAEELSSDVEKELKQAYLNQIAEYPEGLLENVKLLYYYGTYNGNIVIRIYSNYICMDPMVNEEVYIGNVVFKSYPDVVTWVYHIEADDDQTKEEEEVGTFYSLQEAYDKELLEHEDLMSIAYYHNGGREYNEEIMSKDYSPSPKTPEVLSGLTELKIKNTAAKDYREKLDISDAVANGFTITEYCGTYGDCVAIMMRDEYSGTSGAEWIDSVAGVNIYYNSGKEIQIWRATK